MPVHWPPRSSEASPPPGVVGNCDRGLETSGVSRALEKAERYGDIDELSAVLEKGESGPSVDTEKRTGSLGVVGPEAS